LGIGYILPVSTLIKWFPDRPGLTTGLAIMGFSGGALIASPLYSMLARIHASQSIASHRGSELLPET
jgi:alpha/beta superfamily hydrolase